MADKSVFMLVYACLLAGCGVSGPPVGAPYRPVDMHADLGKIDGNTVLAGPAGWTPAPSITTPVFKAAAPELFAAMREIMQGQPRTWLMGSSPEQNQASFIVRSLVMNFPDVVVVQAVAATPSTSKAVIFSQSIPGLRRPSTRASVTRRRWLGTSTGTGSSSTAWEQCSPGSASWWKRT